MEEPDRAKRLAELQKQRDELDKLIRELAAEEVQERKEGLETNIPYTTPFVARYSFRRPSRLGSTSPAELLEMKMFVNKKCNQISSDYSHTISLVAEILRYRENAVFQELFVHKLIEQGKGQVAAHLDSYKPFSYILSELRLPELLNDYVNLMITRRGNEQELKGIYAIYFGYLSLQGDVSGCWLWMASVLNCAPGETTGYVLEVFLKICGEMLSEKCWRFRKVIRYIERFYLREIPTEPIRVRIKLLLDYFNQRLGS